MSGAAGRYGEAAAECEGPDTSVCRPVFWARGCEPFYQYSHDRGGLQWVRAHTRRSDRPRKSRCQKGHGHAE